MIPVEVTNNMSLWGDPTRPLTNQWIHWTREWAASLQYLNWAYSDIFNQLQHALQINMLTVRDVLIATLHVLLVYRRKVHAKGAYSLFRISRILRWQQTLWLHVEPTLRVAFIETHSAWESAETQLMVEDVKLAWRDQWLQLKEILWLPQTHSVALDAQSSTVLTVFST